MEPEQARQLEHILGRMAVGVAILDCTDWRLRYINPHFLSLLEEPWRSQGAIGHRFDEIAPTELQTVALPILQQVCSTGQSISFPDVPYEGFLKTRGRTYWQVSIEPAPTQQRSDAPLSNAMLAPLRSAQHTLPTPHTVSGGGGTNARQYAHIPPSLATDREEQTQSTTPKACDALLVTVEDQTSLVRSRLHLKAIQHISSAIAGPFALPQVLDRILQAVQEMVGSTRCAVILLDESVASIELRIPGFEEQLRAEMPNRSSTPPIVSIAAQQGVHLRSQDWRPQVSEQLLVGHVVRDRRPLIIEDTSTVPGIEFPLLDDEGVPRRPGSVLCIPIFEPTSDQTMGENSVGTRFIASPTGAVLGTIEVYHRRVRGFPAEEVELLAQFAQQAGLAIQNARLFRSINSLAQMASRNARQRENIMQAIPDGVIIYDSRWRVADVNQAARTLFGWSDDVIGLHVTAAFARSGAIFQHDFSDTPLRNALSATRPLGEIGPTLDNTLPSPPDIAAELERLALERRIDELKLIGANGQHYTMRRSQAPIHDELGDIFAFAVIYHDVTEQAVAREHIEAEVIARTAELAQRNLALQLAKAAQELESARMQLLLECLPSGVILVSADRDITLINRLGALLLQRMGWNPWSTKDTPGDDPDLAIGLNIEEVLRTITMYGTSGSVIAYEEQPLSLALRLGEANEAELHAIQRDGQALFLLVNAAPLRASDGTISSVVSVWHDITKLKLLERAREDFFTTMAHELKTPLANIRAHLSAPLARDLEWSVQEQQDFLEVADEQVERLVGMINFFLDASRVEAGALRLELEAILLPEMLEDLEDRLEALITYSQRRLLINASADLPAVWADYELIMSVLTNLLSNAFRYAPEGDPVLLEAVPIFSIPDQPASGVELRVIDRGPGLTQEQQAELFTRFSSFAALRRPAADRPGQFPPERRRGSIRWSPATGLGLYISRGIVEAHGSTMTLKSSPGQGATFAFILPSANTIKREGR